MPATCTRPGLGLERLRSTRHDELAREPPHYDFLFVYWDALKTALPSFATAFFCCVLHEHGAVCVHDRSVGTFVRASAAKTL
jgi:hypothetical protein